MRRADPDVIYSFTSADNPVTFTVEPGETFQVETVPTWGREFNSHTGERDSQAEKGCNASTGCIEVEGAAAGQVLVVHVLDMALHEYGFTALNMPPVLLPDVAGAEGWRDDFKSVRIADGFVQWSDKLKIPVAPMIGYVGVATPDEKMSHAHNGLFGGNMDIQEVTTGARVHLPVMVDGALLHIGDVHAVQGDGEINLTGAIETGALLTLKVELADRPASFRGPRIETDDYIAATGFARPAEAAMALALEDLIGWMVEDFGFTPTGAHMLLSQVLQARAPQVVDPLISYICKIRREYLAG